MNGTHLCQNAKQVQITISPNFYSNTKSKKAWSEEIILQSQYMEINSEIVYLMQHSTSIKVGKKALQLYT